MEIKQTSLAAVQKHEEWQGKIEVISRVELKNKESLSLAYTPGVSEVCLRIKEDEKLSYKYTRRHNLVAVITDGTAVLGLGDIGPSAAMPVMEGKCALFKEFGGVDAFPICIDSKDEDEIVRTIKLISKSFGGINLEDIASPRCFSIEEKLREICDIPVFHDDQHGTAVVIAAALINAMKLTLKDKSMRIVINGAGAAGIATAKLLLAMGFENVDMCDTQGAVVEGDDGLNAPKIEIAKLTNRSKRRGTLTDLLIGADCFIGLSKGNLVRSDMVRTMANDAIVFAMANPIPEISPEEAKAGGAAVVGTGRSDLPNQINNALVFPGLFRGLFDSGITKITDEVKMAVAEAIAKTVPYEKLCPDYIIPDPFDRNVVNNIVKALRDLR